MFCVISSSLCAYVITTTTANLHRATVVYRQDLRAVVQRRRSASRPHFLLFPFLFEPVFDGSSSSESVTFLTLYLSLGLNIIDFIVSSHLSVVRQAREHAKREESTHEKFLVRALLRCFLALCGRLGVLARCRAVVLGQQLQMIIN